MQSKKPQVKRTQTKKVVRSKENLNKLQQIEAMVGFKQRKCYVHDFNVYCYWVNRDKTDAGLDVIKKKLITGKKTLMQIQADFEKKYENNYEHRTFECTQQDIFDENTFGLLLEDAIQKGLGNLKKLPE